MRMRRAQRNYVPFVAGYGGVRLAQNGDMLIKNPIPPPNCTAMRMRQMAYLGNFVSLVRSQAFFCCL